MDRLAPHATPPTAALSARVARAIRLLQADLETAFGARLVSLVLYGRHVPGGPAAEAPEGTIHTLALIASLEYADLAACAQRAEGWDRAGLAMPLLLTPAEFASSLDSFALEYGAIIAHHFVVVGDDPFHGITVRADDRRRACEVQAKSHVIHLREGFLEAEGRAAALVRLIGQSIGSFAALLGNLAELDRADADDGGHETRASLARYAATRIGLSDTLVARLLALADGDARALAPDDAAQLYPPYLDASERVARFADAWKETPSA